MYQPSWSENASWTEGVAVSLDFYNLEVENTSQGRDPGDLIDACAKSGDPFFCDLTPRTSSEQLDVVKNQLQNIGAICSMPRTST